MGAALALGCGSLVGIEEVQRADSGAAGGEIACVVCGGSCVSLDSNEHCGSCDHTCTGGTTCLAGVCDRRLGGGADGRVLCVRDAAGQLLCRGANDAGQLGRGTTSTGEAAWGPMVLAAADLPSFAASGADVTCLRLESGEVRCTGSNGLLIAPSGQGSSFRDLSVGSAASASAPVCAIGGRAGVCWGISGDDAAAHPITGGDAVQPWTQVRVGAGFVCLLDAAGSVWCSGTVGESTLGSLPPTQAVPGLRARFLAATPKSACAVDVDNAVQCWGGNEFGERGEGTTAPRVSQTPRRLPATFPAPLLQIVAGRGHYCVLDDRGEVYCWGDAVSAGDGRSEGASCANGACRPLPELVPLHGVVELAAAGRVTLARRDDGSLFAWGASTAADCLLGALCEDTLWLAPRELSFP